MPFAPHAMLAHQWRNLSTCCVDIWNPLQLKEKTCPWGIDYNKDHFSSKLRLSNNPMKKINLQNQINKSGVDNDNICQHANTIN
jgi:hypothetical protein